LKILVTGSNGLVGLALCTFLEQSGHTVIRTVRRSAEPWEIEVGHIDADTNWSPALSGRMDAVVHLAARVHVMQTESEDARALYHHVNTRGTLNLAMQCAAQGVKRFIFISTVKVLGEGRDQPYNASDPAVPVGPYAVSKWEAEQGLLEIAAKSEMEVVVLRPPLVYGPGVKANFLRLLQLVNSGVPLPLGCIQNRRSLVYVGNLIDAIAVCLAHPAAAGKSYLVSDGENVSTTELVRRIGFALRRPSRLLPLPSNCIRWTGKLLGKEAAVERLLGSLAVDSTQIQADLEWTPPYTMQAGLEATAEWYHKFKSKR
jgi:nucleoside-diphosphate-sugar epimerase